MTRVLDLGAGTGAAGVAARKRFGEGVQVVAVDKVGGPGLLTADLRQPGRPQGVGGRFDLIVAAHLLNELGLDLPRRMALVTSWMDELLAPGGTCLLLEPAPRQVSRDLLALRDQLMAEGRWILAPCFRQGPCPALDRERDFCHDSAHWEPVARGRSRVDFSYLVLRAARPVDLQPSPLFRVVSDPMEEKGRTKLFVCGETGRTGLVRLHRHREGNFAGFDEATRGDVLQLSGTETNGEGFRVGPQSQIRRWGSDEIPDPTDG